MHQTTLRRERMPRVDIDRAALARNWRRLDQLSPGARTGAAVKANGYGLGAQEVARTLFDAGCRDFFVAWPEEGAAVRKALGDASRADCRIFVLQGMEKQVDGDLIAAGLTPVLSNRDDLAIWAESTMRGRTRAPAALQFETGMNRLGLDERDLVEAQSLIERERIKIALVMSHLASADENAAQSERQRERFVAMTALAPKAPRSLANSAGLFLGRSYHFDLTRPGIALYGGYETPAREPDLEPVATLTASILQVRTAAAGELAGYGGAARLERPTRIATVGLGYADGYPRALSGDGVPIRDGRVGPSASIAGHRVPVLGRISMDLTLLDLTDVPTDIAAPGVRAEFFGPNVPIADVADAAGTIPYELLTGLGPRVYRSWNVRPK